MKCLILGVSDRAGGAARAQYRLFRGLLEIKEDVSMLVKKCAKSEPNIFMAKTNGFIEYFKERFDSVILKDNRTDLSNTLFSFALMGSDISNHPLVKEADIINIHFINSFLSIDDISKIIKLGKPVVFTFHDMWSLTGGCHYSAFCEKYENECDNCPQIKRDGFHIIKSLFYKKLDTFNASNVSVITPSRWLSSLAKSSRIFENIGVETIPNSLETDIFYIQSKESAKEKIALDKERVAILFGTFYHSENRKGFRELLLALDYCKKSSLFNEYLREQKIEIIIFGNPSEELANLDIPIRSMGFINNDELLSTVYSASDFLILPSLEDNLPNIMIESLACGTPVVAFDIGGIPDVVKDGFNGLLSPLGDPSLLGENIIKLLTDEQLRKELQSNSGKDFDKMFSLKTQALNYKKLFEERVANNVRGTKKIESKNIYNKKSYKILYFLYFPKLIMVAVKLLFKKLFKSKESDK